MAKAPSLPRIEVAEIAIQQILAADIPTATRDLLERSLAAVTALRPTTDPDAHKPVYVTALDGTENVVGCACGATPKTRAARASMTAAFFHSHLAKVGVPRPDFLDTRYATGPYAGMTWDERRAAETAAAT